jgi:hypothetical protein
MYIFWNQILKLGLKKADGNSMDFTIGKTNKVEIILLTYSLTNFWGVKYN